jgi:hypothetical protein
LAVERIALELARLARRGDLDAVRRIAAPEPAPPPPPPPTPPPQDGPETLGEHERAGAEPAGDCALSLASTVQASTAKGPSRDGRVTFSRFITTVRTSPLSVTYELVRSPHSSP